MRGKVTADAYSGGRIGGVANWVGKFEDGIEGQADCDFILFLIKFEYFWLVERERHFGNVERRKFLTR
jgi:hypothetical protein